MVAVKKNLKSHLARSSSADNRLQLFVGQISTTCSNATEVAQWATPSCYLPQTAMDNGIRDDRSN